MNHFEDVFKRGFNEGVKYGKDNYGPMLLTHLESTFGDSCPDCKRKTFSSFYTHCPYCGFSFKEE